MAQYIDDVHVYVDGGCRGNPGPGAIAIIIYAKDGSELERHAECIGNTTNNRAEYAALIKGLNLGAGHTRRTVRCLSDCELLVKQLNGEFRLRDDKLRALFFEVKQLEVAFEHVVYQHVPRTHQQMRAVDRLVNEAFEGRLSAA